MALSRSARRLVTAFVVLSILSVVALVAIGVAVQKQEAVKQGSILVIPLRGAIAESPKDDLSTLFSGGSDSINLWDLRRALIAAKDDDAIAGILVEGGSVQAQIAQIDELYSIFDTFRESGKPVHVLDEGDTIDDGVYATALVGDHIWINPEALVAINGFSASVTFWRGTLDKLHVVPDVLMFEEYKSAGEPFLNKEMSPAFREALTDVVGDIQGDLFAQVAARRKVDEAVLMALVNQGFQTATELKNAGLVDELGYRDQAREALRVVAGTEELETVTLKKYLKSHKEDRPDGDRIALVFGEGQIVSSESDSPWGNSMLEGPVVARNIRKAAEDDRVKAILFRVNSPGGSAVGSDQIWREIERAQEKGKPVIVSMSGVAGSGGYWVSMGADAIVAWPDTITGSIGVVFTKMNITGLYEWAGANVVTVNFTDNADIMSEFRNLDEAQLATTRRVLGEMYDHFRAKVADGRNIPREQVDAMAKGRIWSGKKGLENGLVDKLGGYDVAIALVREKASLGADVPVVVYPAPEDPIQKLLSGDFSVSTQQPTLAELEPLLRELSTPRAAALMPEITIE